MKTLRVGIRQLANLNLRSWKEPHWLEVPVVQP